MTTSAFAAHAYASTANLNGKANLGKAAGNGSGTEGEFGDLVNQAISDVAASGQKAESLTADLVAGKADVVDLVTAVAETELAVESLVTIRDKVISAYQEILSMPI
jgi:flagellar hook-basal body complex protein FliE